MPINLHLVSRLWMGGDTLQLRHMLACCIQGVEVYRIVDHAVLYKLYCHRQAFVSLLRKRLWVSVLIYYYLINHGGGREGNAPLYIVSLYFLIFRNVAPLLYCTLSMIPLCKKSFLSGYRDSHLPIICTFLC